jgi:hypothetical protein
VLAKVGNAVTAIEGQNTLNAMNYTGLDANFINAWAGGNTMLANTSNTLTATNGQNILTAVNNTAMDANFIHAPVGGNTITGQLGNVMNATTAANTFNANATGGANVVNANGANGSNTVSALGAGGVNTITADTRNSILSAGAVTDANFINATVGGNTMLAKVGNTMTAFDGKNTLTANNSTSMDANSINAAAGGNSITGQLGNVVNATTGANTINANSANGSNMVNALGAGGSNTMTADTRNVLQSAGTSASANLISATGLAGGNSINANTAKGSNNINANGLGGVNNINANSTTGINNIEAKTNNIGVASANSINLFGNASSGTSVLAHAGNSTMSVVNGSVSLTAGASLSSNGSSGSASGGGAGGLAVYQVAQTIAAGASIPSSSQPNGILEGKTYQNKVNGNLLVDGNVYINGALNYVSSSTANTTVVGSSTGVGASILPNATKATSGGTAIVMKGASGTQTVVDANGKISNVGGEVATQSTAAMTLTNGLGNTHGLVITENQATLSGGTSSSSLTMADNGATLSDAASGGPVQLHGVNDGKADFDAINMRQFAGAIASVTAMANIPQVDQDKTFAVGAGVGNFMGKSALAIGATYRFTRNGVIKGSVSTARSASQSTTMGLGAALSF